MNDEARTSLETALPAYEIAGKLGEGAFGVVYEARHTTLGRQVAIKQLPRVFAEDADVRERFVAEAQMVASLDHPHIVPVYDFVESEGSRFLIMEKCEGSVGERFKSEGIVTDEACSAILACLAALDFAHEKGLLHRDVKPENLMYDAKGVVKLGDFGIARDLGIETRRTATGMIIGTPAYMSPEQCRGDDLTPASDVYSVAVMGYELLTGALPFPQSGSVNGLIAHHLVTEPTPLLATRPELPGAVGEVIDRALSKDLGVRYSTAAEFATALARACVRAFGSGWIRRRRFVLHWPEIIAETERPDGDSPRTGTIIVRAGELPHAVITPEQAALANEPTAQMQPTPVAVVGEPAIEPAPATAVVPTEVSLPVAPPTAGPESSGTNWKLLAAVLVGLGALIAGIIAFASGGAESGLTVTEPALTPAETVAQDADEPTSEPAPTEAAVATPEPVAATTVPLPVETPTPFVVLLTERPQGVDLRDASSPWAPTPCPEGPERVACIYAGVVTDEETGELTIPYFTEGFVPQLEPADYHLHFYLDTAVNGDETKAGTETPGGSWKIWDAPFPATSFGGENGRSLFTLSDYQSTNARFLCVLVADPQQRAIPGSGNCSPLIQYGDDEALLRQVNRLQGKFIGSCAIGATVIVPNEWRSADLVETSVADAARQLRPAAAADTEVVLQELIDAGGILWADGPVENDFVTNFSLSTYPGNFELDDSPDEVMATLNGLGISTDGATQRIVDGRQVLYSVSGNGSVSSATYVIADYGYAIAMTYTASLASGQTEMADAIAATITGC